MLTEGLRSAIRLGLLGLALLGFGGPARAAHPNALWRVVHDLCVPDMKLLGLPAPCLAVDLARGTAVVPDLGDPTQILLTPTVKVSGIESPELLRPGAPNYWREAWAARTHLEARAGKRVPREASALAINSAVGRSQGQLHIHVDCVDAGVRDRLVADLPRFSRRWRAWNGVPWRRYRVRLLRGEALTRDPFRLLADGVPGARADMGAWTLAVVGARLADGPGFFLLADHADPRTNDAGHGEEVLDHACRVLKTPAAGTVGVSAPRG